jgi:DNA-binding transcriptional MerR regulator
MQEQSITYVSTSGFARRLNVSPDRIRQLAREGRIHPAIVTERGERLYTPQEIERFRLSREASS